MSLVARSLRWRRVEGLASESLESVLYHPCLISREREKRLLDEAPIPGADHGSSRGPASAIGLPGERCEKQIEETTIQTRSPAGAAAWKLRRLRLLRGL